MPELQDVVVGDVGPPVDSADAEASKPQGPSHSSLSQGYILHELNPQEKEHSYIMRAFGIGSNS